MPFIEFKLEREGFSWKDLLILLPLAILGQSHALLFILGLAFGWILDTTLFPILFVLFSITSIAWIWFDFLVNGGMSQTESGTALPPRYVKGYEMERGPVSWAQWFNVGTTLFVAVGYLIYGHFTPGVNISYLIVPLVVLVVSNVFTLNKLISRLEFVREVVGDSG